MSLLGGGRGDSVRYSNKQDNPYVLVGHADLSLVQVDKRTHVHRHSTHTHTHRGT